LVLIVPCLGADFTLPWCSLGLVLVLISLCFGADLVFVLMLSSSRLGAGLTLPWR
jgi:hypothetical protein